jgi:hypothetical protein
MPKNKIILTIGFLIALLPVFGFPHTWEIIFQTIGGLSIVFLSVMISVDKRITLKAKAQKRHNKRRALSEPITEGPTYGRRATDLDVNGNKIRFGRRATDIVLPVQTVNPEDTTSQEFTL